MDNRLVPLKSLSAKFVGKKGLNPYCNGQPTSTKGFNTNN